MYIYISFIYESGHEGARVFLHGFAIKWSQNQATRQAQLRDQAHIEICIS